MEKKKELTQEVFEGQPESVNWCGVDYDGRLSFGVFKNPRCPWSSERWRGFDQIGESIEETNYKACTSLKRINNT